MAENKAERLSTLVEILRQHPGLLPHHLYYWEIQGWIKPIKIKVRERYRKRYNFETAARIGHIWHLVQRGYTPRAAIEIIDKGAPREPRDTLSIYKIEAIFEEFFQRVWQEILPKIPNPDDRRSAEQLLEELTTEVKHGVNRYVAKLVDATDGGWSLDWIKVEMENLSPRVKKLWEEHDKLLKKENIRPKQ